MISLTKKLIRSEPKISLLFRTARKTEERIININVLSKNRILPYPVKSIIQKYTFFILSRKITIVNYPKSNYFVTL
ncbi:hypothetical protein MSMAC_2408 [Methanosarcina mazei C16]|uniref:Uncharacterized protein n=1 Tax=Methanosarcina mazei C16 TaxID=1434113 RepID=A0A0E3S189_METMZ|nr:hypothetical protein MSMAC_2408 [Methanosarcina mazei C16]